MAQLAKINNSTNRQYSQGLFERTGSLAIEYLCGLTPSPSKLHSLQPMGPRGGGPGGVKVGQETCKFDRGFTTFLPTVGIILFRVEMIDIYNLSFYFVEKIA